ncbi:MAG TPA: hypothetical protein VGW80_00940 [Solirubrobacterales bacterium]|jgi:hypothetical protein|nr:hypothetical protein [Solirubrobacterales bacterium]
MSAQMEEVRRPQAHEPCEECGAPMDPQQRYCVHCAARRGNGANPSSRYFATMSKRARPPLVRPAAKQSPTSRAAAVGFFALLPVAVAIGVMIGHNGSGGDEEALLKALRERQATTASVAAGPTTAAATTATPKGTKKKAAKGEKANAKPEEKVVAHTSNGDVHEVTNFKASEEKEAEDTKLVEENPEQTGENYIKAQQNLPDVIVVGGEGGSTAPSPSGVEP